MIRGVERTIVSIGAGKESAFLSTVEQLKARLAPGASMLILVGETPALDALVDAVGADDSNVLRQPLSSEQAAELTAEA